MQVNSYRPIEMTLNAVFLWHFPPLLVGGIPVPVQMKKTSRTACLASSILSNGKVSLTMIKLSSQ